MHTKEIRNEGITSLLQTLNLVVQIFVNWMTPSGSGQWASSIWKWEECKKTPRTPALNRKESQLFDNNESEKNEEHSSSVKIGLFVFSGPLLAILLKDVFSLNCKSNLVVSQCNLTKPQVEICFQNAFMPLRFVVNAIPVTYIQFEPNSRDLQATVLANIQGLSACTTNVHQQATLARLWISQEN